MAAAREEAAQTGQNLLVHFWAPWCGPCQRLESTVFNQPAVATMVQQGLIPVKLNFDEVPQIARTYGVTRLPTDVILRPDGAVLARFGSPHDPSAYLAQVAPFSAVNRSRESFAGQGRGAQAQFAGQGEVTGRMSGGTRPWQGQGEGYGDPFAGRSGPAAAAGGSAFAGNRMAAAPSGPVQSAYTHLNRPSQTTPPPNDGNQQAMNSNFAAAAPSGYGASAEASYGESYRTGPLAARARAGSGPAEGAYRGSAGPAYRTSTPGSLATSPTQDSRYSSYNSGMGKTADSPTSGVRDGREAAAAWNTPPRSDNGPASSAAMLNNQSPQNPRPSQNFAYDPPAVTSGATTAGPAGGHSGMLGGPTPPGTAANRPNLGLDGFCPVTLKREQRWIPGDNRYGIVHRGRLYLFAGPQQQQQFWADPDGYSPALSGIDPVLALDNGATVPGQREHGVEYNGQVYLFSSESTLQHFSRNPERYAGGVRQAMQGGTGTGTTIR